MSTANKVGRTDSAIPVDSHVRELAQRVLVLFMHSVVLSQR
jgi:hypothetical protein